MTMGQQDPRARHLRQLPDAGAGADRAPSRVAQERLSGALRNRADAYRADASVDLTLVDVLVQMDQLEAAARTLDDHRASLRAMAQDLQVVVADAAVEREAERVYDTCLRQLRPAAPLAGGVRRRLMALTGAAAVFVALLLPSTRISPRTILASIEDRVMHDEVAEARSRLDAARSTAEAVRAGQPVDVRAPRALQDPAVRKQVRAILAAGQGESAAPLSSDPVAVLSDVRAAKRRPTAHGAAPHPDGDLAPVVPLRVRDGAASPGAPDAMDLIMPAEDGDAHGAVDEPLRGDAPDLAD